MANVPDFVKGEIYKITCLVNDKKYIGQTKTHRFRSGRNEWYPAGSQKRFKEHIKEAFGVNPRGSTRLNHALKKYGVESFTVDIICSCELNELDEKERFYITQYDSRETGYNLTDGGQFASVYPNFSAYESNSVSQMKLIDDERTLYLGQIKDSIKSVHMDDVTISFHGIRMDIHTIDGSKIRWIFSNRTDDMWELFIRSYYIVYPYVQNDTITVSHRLAHYLDQFETSIWADHLEKREIVTKSISTNMTDLNTRYGRYCDYHIQHITLKLGNKNASVRICVCIRATEKPREIVSEFGGTGVSVEDSVHGAFALALKLADKSIISIRPELLNFITTNNIKLEWQPPVTRKPRNVFNK